MSPDPLAPPGPEDLIQKPKPPDGLPCADPVPVPAIVNDLRWTDYLHMGARRALKTALYLGASIGAVAGIAIMSGTPWLLALKGAVVTVASGSLAMGAGKMAEEKLKAEGKRPGSEKVAEWVIAIIAAVFKYFSSRKGVQK